ncbi:hypothetical protein M758_9G174100 [Ceratodon purpureus]|nr:hypothetical protein M758_9G174100 [Ceratodon purpureus]
MGSSATVRSILENRQNGVVILTFQTFDEMLHVKMERDIVLTKGYPLLSVGDNEQFFQVFNDHLSIATARRRDNSVVELDKLIKEAVKKAAKNRKLREALGEALAKVMSKSGTTVNINEQLQYLESLLVLFPKSVCSELEQVFGAMLVSALVLLYCVSQYLMGYADRGRSKTYSSGSLDFRDIYVSIVLFQGAYVWIKFRQAARSGCHKRKSCEAQDVAARAESGLKGIYPRPVKDKAGTITHYKYEPRFKPPRKKLDSGTLQFDYLYLGSYDTPAEAKIVYQIAAFFYGKGEGCVALENDSFYFIPPMSEEAKCLTGKDKAKWVTRKTKTIFESLQPKQARLKQPRRAAEVGTRSGPDGIDAGSDPSQSAIGDTSPLPALCRSAVESALIASVELAPAQGGSASEQLADCVPGGSTYEPVPAVEHISGVSCSGEQYNVMGNESDIALESDDQGESFGLAGLDFSEWALSDHKDMIAELMFPDSTNISPQQPSFPDLEGSVSRCDRGPLQFDGAIQAFEFVEPQVSPKLDFQQGCDVLGAIQENIVTTRGSTDIIFLKERDPVLGQVNHLQQLVSRQKKQLEDSAIRNVDLQYRLTEAEVKNSELEREKLELQQENQHLRAMLQQGAKSQAATWSGIFIDFQQEEGR